MPPVVRHPWCATRGVPPVVRPRAHPPSGHRAVLSSHPPNTTLDTRTNQLQLERQPVARANAALSESNWREAVRVPSTLGLDPRAAELLSSVAGAGGGRWGAGVAVRGMGMRAWLRHRVVTLRRAERCVGWGLALPNLVDSIVSSHLHTACMGPRNNPTSVEAKRRWLRPHSFTCTMGSPHGHSPRPQLAP